MRNARRRKEILFLGVLFGTSVRVVELNGFQQLQQAGPLTFLKPINDQFEAVIPERQREKELYHLKMVVNNILPPNSHRSRADQMLWFACHVTYLLVTDGWKLPDDPLHRQFIQSAFDMSKQLSVTLPDGWMEHAAKVPDLLRKNGFYC